MAGSMNKVILIGRAGKDAELAYSENGVARAKFSMATDESYRDKQTGEKVERTEWHRCIAFNRPAEFLGEALTKGRLVMVEGKIQTRKWVDKNSGQDRYSTEIVAQRVQLLDSRPQEQVQQQQGQQGQTGQQYQQDQGEYQRYGSQNQAPQGGYQGGGYGQGQR